MFEHWMTFAPTMCRQLRLGAETIVRAHEVVCSTMGTPWIEEQERGSSAKTFADRHPLDSALRGRTPACVLEVLQLAGYLCAFRDDRHLGRVIESLRDPGKYEPTVFELDVAWKFRAAGAQVALWPVTPRGREADFAATVSGAEHIVETSVFPSDPLRGPVASFFMAMTNACNRALERSRIRPIPAVELDVAEVSGQIRSAAHAALSESINQYRDNGRAQRLERVYPFGTVVVRPTVPGEAPRSDSRWTMASRFGSARLAPSKFLGETDYSIRAESSWLYLCDRSFDPDPYARLQKKLKKEASQLSGCRDGVIVLHAESLEPDVLDDMGRLNYIMAQFGRQHANTTGVALATQPENENGTRGIGGHYFALGSSALSREFWQRVVDVDDRWSVLDELDFLESS